MAFQDCDGGALMSWGAGALERDDVCDTLTVHSAISQASKLQGSTVYSTKRFRKGKQWT